MSLDQATRKAAEDFCRGGELSLATTRALVLRLVQLCDEESAAKTGAGITLRDSFATAALIHAMTSEDGRKAAIDAYKLADQMLKIRTQGLPAED